MARLGEMGRHFQRTTSQTNSRDTLNENVPCAADAVFMLTPDHATVGPGVKQENANARFMRKYEF